MGEDEKKPQRLRWLKLFSSPTSARYKLITGQDYILDGVKTLCDGGHPEQAYIIISKLLESKFPILPNHIDFIPRKCSVFEAKELFDYEDSGYIYAVEGYSGSTGVEEFSCIFIDDVLNYIRICTKNEVDLVWTVFHEEL